MSKIASRLYASQRKREREALACCRANLDVVEADTAYKDPSNPTRGKCYFAAVALYRYLGGKSRGYSLMKAQEEIGTHYWVANRTGEILDPTIDQFVIMKREPPYHLGKAVSVRPNTQSYKPLLEAMEKTNE
jgi:hypothetical protein